MTGTRTQEWAERAKAHLLGSDGIVGGTAEVIFEKGEGIILTDVEGKDYIDVSSFVQACNLGYDNTEIIDAMTKQARKLHFGYSALIEISITSCSLPGERNLWSGQSS